MIRGPIPRIYHGEDFVLIGSGPSLTREQCEAARAKGYRTLVVNRAFEYAPWASVMYGADPPMWETYWDGCKDIPLKITCHEATAEKLGLWFVEGTNHQMPGLNTNPERVNYGLHSGFQAINVAYHLGAKSIRLLGYDCRHENGKAHFHPDHTGPGMSNAPATETWRRRYVEIAEQKLLPIINCTPGSAIDCFPREEI